MALEQGATREAAAGAANINRDTLWRWVKADPSFSDAVERAEDFAKWRATKAVADAFGESWQAAMTWLERRDPKNYARRERIDVSLDIRREVEKLAAELGIDKEAALAEAERILSERS